MPNQKSSAKPYHKKSSLKSSKEGIEILFQDKWLAVVYKPSGLLSVPFEGYRGRTAQGLLEEILRKKGEINKNHKPFAVHRLDRDTSGIMMFALTAQAHKIIMDNWHTMVTERLYRALCDNPVKIKKPLQDEGLIDLPLALNAHNIGFVPEPGSTDSKGRPFKTIPARTNYKILIKGKTHTLFELSLDTGKKNQIRAHLSYYGYPLCGDEEHRARTNPFGRLCLHARTLEFVHPFTKESLHFERAEPEEWLSFVNKK